MIYVQMISIEGPGFHSFKLLIRKPKHDLCSDDQQISSLPTLKKIILQNLWSCLYLDVFQTGEHHIAHQVHAIVVPVLSHRQNAIYTYSIAWDLRLFQLAERLGETFFHGVSATPRCTVSVVCEAG
jgi:hypothetical protein